MLVLVLLIFEVEYYFLVNEGPVVLEVCLKIFVNQTRRGADSGDALQRNMDYHEGIKANLKTCVKHKVNIGCSYVPVSGMSEQTDP